MTQTQLQVYLREIERKMLILDIIAGNITRLL
jgi:hypothetical protein